MEDTKDLQSAAPLERLVGRRCCCRHLDARDCFLARHPECRRTSDTGDRFDLYDSTIDEVCDCDCHHEDHDDFGLED